MFLNLHTHSNYSDGVNSLGELVSAFKRKGHACLCLTDHDYAMSSYSYDKQRQEAAELSKAENFPIICGIEISCGGSEEALLFGTKACEEWLTLRQVNDLSPMGTSGFSFMDGQFLKWANGTKQEKALVLCHPTMCARIENFYDVFDGYEIKNGGSLWPKSKRDLMQRLMPKAKAFSNYDLHNLRCLDHILQECNEVSEPIETETDLMRYIKG